MGTFNIILAFGHIIFGGYFFLMGLNHFLHLDSLTAYASSKKVPHPKFAVIISGTLVALGGLGIVSGLFVTASSILVMLFLAPVTVIMHTYWKETDSNAKMAEMQHFLKNVALFGGALIVLAVSLS